MGSYWDTDMGLQSCPAWPGVTLEETGGAAVFSLGISADWRHSQPPPVGAPGEHLEHQVSPNQLLIIKLLTEGKVNRVFG